MNPTLTLDPGLLLTKTDKGIDEIRNRSARLAARLRALLLLVDGARPVAELVAMCPATTDAPGALNALLDEGFVEPRSATAVRPLQMPRPVSPSAQAAAGEDALRITGAKMVMLRSVRLYLGMFEGRGLSKQIGEAHSIAELAACLESLCSHFVGKGENDTAAGLRSEVAAALAAQVA